MNYPLKIVFLKQDKQEERLAFGREVQDGRTIRVLIYEPNGKRYLLVNWCEAHGVGHEEETCPLCREPGERMRAILTAGV